MSDANTGSEPPTMIFILPDLVCWRMNLIGVSVTDQSKNGREWRHSGLSNVVNKKRLFSYLCLKPLLTTVGGSVQAGYLCSFGNIDNRCERWLCVLLAPWKPPVDISDPVGLSRVFYLLVKAPGGVVEGRAYDVSIIASTMEECSMVGWEPGVSEAYGGRSLFGRGGIVGGFLVNEDCEKFRRGES